MNKPLERKRSELGLIQLLPNMMTIGAICAGLTAIRFGVQGNYVLAVQLILAAALLDGLDGRLARALGSDSRMGAELDSLADFLNFGVAAPLVIYFWGLQDMKSAGWIPVLVFSVCCVIRLARFNVSSKSEEPAACSAYFTGVPSPAGALLAMLPMFIAFAFADAMTPPGWLIGLHMAVIGFAMISRIPTWSPKAVKVSRDKVKYCLVGFVAIGAAVLIYAWTTLVLICAAYMGLVIWGLVRKPSH